MSITRKPRKCRICKELFMPLSMSHKVCWEKECITEFIRQTEQKAHIAGKRAERKELKQRKEAIKTRSDWIKTAQVAFNAFIRYRDKDKPCICCGRTTTDHDLITGSRWDAGHYRSTGSAPHLRFNEFNVHRQLVLCNRFGAGRAVDYRIGLVKRIGVEFVELLELDNEPRKWTIDDLKGITATYRAKLKALKNGH